jgi:copper chaperone
MKRMLTLVLISALSLTLAACGSGAKASSTDTKENAVAAEKLQIVNFKVKDMTCASCPFIVESAISELEGISEVNAEFPDQATVTFDPSKVSIDQIKQAVIDVGYGVE